MTTAIRDFYNRIIGYVDTQPDGSKTYRDFYQRVVARYDARTNQTRDFYQRVVGYGDMGASLLPRK